MTTYFLTEEAQDALQTFQKYWTDTYPNTTFTISQRSQIIDENGTHSAILIGRAPTKQQARLNELLSDCLLSDRTDEISHIDETLEAMLPVPKGIGYGRQIEVYAEVQRRIQFRLDANESLNMVLANIALLSHQEPKRIATIAQRSLKLINTLGGIKYFRKITPQTLYKMTKRDFQHLINSIEEASNGFLAFSFGGDDVTCDFEDLQ